MHINIYIYILKIFFYIISAKNININFVLNMFYFKKVNNLLLVIILLFLFSTIILTLDTDR